MILDVEFDTSDLNPEKSYRQLLLNSESDTLVLSPSRIVSPKGLKAIIRVIGTVAEFKSVDQIAHELGLKVQVFLGERNDSYQQ